MNSSPISATSDSGKGGGNVGGIGGSGGGGGNSAITSSKNPPSSSKKDQALIEQVVAEIRRDWNVMLQDDSFNPVPLALEMLQNSNPSHNKESFQRLFVSLEKAMEIIVENNYSGFNGAVTTFSSIVENIRDCQIKTKALIDETREFQNIIQYKLFDASDAIKKHAEERQVFEFSKKLNNIKEWQRKINDLISKKMFVPASELMFKSRQTSSQLQKSLDPLFLNQLNQNYEELQQQLVDSLCNYLFLKNSNSQIVLFSRAALLFPELKKWTMNCTFKARLDLYIDDSFSISNVPKEANPIAFINSLVLASNISESLSNVLSSLEQRASYEIHQIISKQLMELSDLFHHDANIATGHGSSRYTFKLGNDSMLNDDNGYEIMSFLMRESVLDLIGKLLIIFTNFKGLWEEVIRILDGKPIPPTNIGTLERICRTLILEISTFAKLFIRGDETRANLSLSNLGFINEALKGRKHVKNVKKTMFCLSTSKAEEDGGEVGVGGMVTMSLGGLGALTTDEQKESAQKTSRMIVQDRYSTHKEYLGYKEIVKPNVLYITTLYRPINRFHKLIRKHINLDKIIDTQNILDIILETELIPMLEEYSIQEIAIAFNSPDCLDWKSFANNGNNYNALICGKNANCISNCVLAFIRVFYAILTCYHHVATRGQLFESLLSQIMSHFMDKIESKLRDLLTSNSNEMENERDEIIKGEKMGMGGSGGSGGVNMTKDSERGMENNETPFTFYSTSANLIENQEIKRLLSELIKSINLENASCMNGNLEFLSEKEAFILEKLKNDRSLHKMELIVHNPNLRSLAILQRSLDLLPKILEGVGEVGHEICNSSPSFPFLPSKRPKPFRDLEGKLNSKFYDGVEESFLEFNNDFSVQYANFISFCNRIAENCLFLLHVEIRMKCFYFLDLAFREGDYELNYETSEPDSYVKNLLKEIILFDNLMTEWLPFNIYRFVMDNLSECLQVILIENFRYIKSINKYGCIKLERNLASLARMLAVINPESVDRLRNVSDYYRLAAAGPDGLFDMANKLERKFTQLQYQAILDVYYKKTGDDTEANKEYSNQIVRLKYLTEPQEKAME